MHVHVYMYAHSDRFISAAWGGNLQLLWRGCPSYLLGVKTQGFGTIYKGVRARILTLICIQCGTFKGLKILMMMLSKTIGVNNASLTMSHGFYLSLVLTFLFLLQSLNNDKNKFKTTLSTCSTLGRNLTLGNSVFITKYQELDFLLHPNLFYHRSIECLLQTTRQIPWSISHCCADAIGTLHPFNLLMNIL